jgi:hypothetical protein
MQCMCDRRWRRTNADAGACVACRSSIVGSAWEEPRYPLHPDGDIGVGDGVSRVVTLLPGDVDAGCVLVLWRYGDVLTAERKSECEAKPRNQREESSKLDDRAKAPAFAQLNSFPLALPSAV